jgi:hypothetical protein
MASHCHACRLIQWTHRSGQEYNAGRGGGAVLTDMDSDATSEAYDKLDFSPDSSGRRRFLNRRTKVMLDIANERLGFELVVIQGSYMLPDEAADDSGPTHSGGGVIDLRTHDIPSDIGATQAVLALREVGFAAFHRLTPRFKEDHIHAVAIGDVQMDESAQRQVDQYGQGLNGLGETDTGPQFDPIPVFDYDEQGPDMQLTDKIPGTDDQTVGDALRAALRVQGEVERLGRVEARRGQQRAERHRKLAGRVAAVAHAVDKLPEGVTKKEMKNLLADVDAAVAEAGAEPGVDSEDDV